MGKDLYSNTWGSDLPQGHSARTSVSHKSSSPAVLPCSPVLSSLPTQEGESWSAGCPKPPPLVRPLQRPRFPHLLTWLDDACSLHPEDKALGRRVRKGPALGAGSVRCPRPRISAPLPRPPLSPPPPLLPAPALLRFSFCRPSHSLTPPCAGVPTRRRPSPPPPLQARPSHSAGDQCAARILAGSPAPSEAERPPPARCHAAAPAGLAKPGGLLGTGPGWPRLFRTAVSLLGGSHHPAGGHVGNGGDLRQGVREHRGRLRRGHRAVPLPRARRLLLLLHGRQGPAQEPVGDAGAQPRRGAGAGLRRAAAARRAARRQPERHAAARLRRHGVAAAARRSAVRARRPRRHLQRVPGVRRRRRRRRACACARGRAPGAALGLLGGAHAQPGGLGRGPRPPPPAAGLRHRAGEHRWRLRRGGRRVPLPPARRLFLLLHAGQAAAQDAVGEADEEPRRGAGHDLRRRRLEAPRDAEPERDAGAAARRRRLAAQPRPRRLRRLQQPRQVHHLLGLPGVPRPRCRRPAGPQAPRALSPLLGGSRGGRPWGVHAEPGPRPERPTAPASPTACSTRLDSANKVGLPLSALGSCPVS